MFFFCGVCVLYRLLEKQTCGINDNIVDEFGLESLAASVKHSIKKSQEKEKIKGIRLILLRNPHGRNRYFGIIIIILKQGESGIKNRIVVKK